MLTIPKTVLVVIFYTIYLSHSIKCLYRSIEEIQSSSNSLGEFVRHIRNMESVVGQEKQKICGTRLPEMVRLVCKSNFYSMDGKRNPNYGFQRYRRELTLRKECCEIGCDSKTLLKYCNLGISVTTTTTPAPPINSSQTVVPFDILRAILEFFTKNLQLSSNGYQSNFPVRTQTASPEISSLQIIEERIPEAAAQTDEQPTKDPRGRHPIPLTNIIRDEDDELSIFSIGL